MIQNPKRERRDWTLLIFIIPLGIFLIIIVGQIAVRLAPNWSVNADMNSNLEPDPNAAQPFALLQPILPQILTPMAWMENYLTPGAAIYFPPFMTLEPTVTPTPTEAAPTQVSDTPAPTASETPSPTSTSATGTASPTDTPEGTEPPGGGGGSSTPPPTTSPTTPPTTPPPTTPPPTACPSNSNNAGDSPPCDYGTIATIDPVLTTATPPPQLNINAPPDNTDPNNDNNVGMIQDGTYIVISLQIRVESTPDGNYDLAYYEWNNGGAVYLDWIIIGITNDPTGSTYYEVFNWGSGTPPDMNSNVGDIAVAEGSEDDDQWIPVSDNTETPVAPPEDQLHDPDYDPGNPPGVPETNGPLPQTGILIDVDNAPSDPPPDTYEFVVIISPPDPPSPPNPPPPNGAQVDAIQATEVPIPTP